MDKRKMLIGPEEIYLLPFGKGFSEIKIGNSRSGPVRPSIHIPINNKYVSRHHCTIIGGEDLGAPQIPEFYIINNRSTNGTYLNGRRIDEAPEANWLERGGIISLARKYSFRVSDWLVDALGNPINKDNSRADLSEMFKKKVISL